MKYLVATILALGAPSSAAAQDNDRDSTLATSITADEMRYVIESAGFAVDAELDDGIGVIGNDNEGLSFGIEGRACNDAGRCLGVIFFALFQDAGTTEYANNVNTRWSAIKATALDDGQLLLSRYLILDHGQTLANLRLNLATTRSIAAAVRSEIMGRNGSDGASPRAAIDWGDDSGNYANDGACDDARFQADGDQWDFQRKHVLRDATDCRARSAAGTITLILDFGDNSGIYANDGTCDDNRFTGEGRSILMTDSHVRRDSADCIAAYREGTINRP